MRVMVSAHWKTWSQITLTFSSEQSWKILDYRLDGLIGLLRNHIHLFFFCNSLSGSVTLVYITGCLVITIEFTLIQYQTALLKIAALIRAKEASDC